MPISSRNLSCNQWASIRLMYATFVLGEERVDVLSLLEKALPQKKIQEILTKTGPEAIYIAGKNENSFTLGVDALLKLLRSEVATLHQEVGALISVTEADASTPRKFYKLYFKFIIERRLVCC